MKTLYNMMEEVENMLAEKNVTEYKKCELTYFDIHEEEGVVKYIFRLPNHETEFHLIAIAGIERFASNTHYKLFADDELYTMVTMKVVEDAIKQITELEEEVQA